MFRNMKIGLQIGIGYALVTTLLIMLAGVSYYDLGAAIDSFNDYRHWPTIPILLVGPTDMLLYASMLLINLRNQTKRHSRHLKNVFLS